MIRLRELTLERDGFSLRELGMLLASVTIVAGAAAFVLAQGRDSSGGVDRISGRRRRGMGEREG